jgi:uncharacterized membrane protein YhhN
MSPSPTLTDVSFVAAGVYGIVLVVQPVSTVRTLVKTAAVGVLALVAYLGGAPLPLIAALALSAAGDAFLAGDPKRWLPMGLAAFLAAHLAYIWLFVTDGFGWTALAAEPLRAVGVAGAILAGVAMLIWLWRGLDPLRPAVVLYAAALSAMVAASFTLPHRLWPAMAGAAAFLASDALLSAELFKGLRARWLTYAVWWLYYGAQYAIAWAYLR